MERKEENAGNPRWPRPGWEADSLWKSVAAAGKQRVILATKV